MLESFDKYIEQNPDKKIIALDHSDGTTSFYGVKEEALKAVELHANQTSSDKDAKIGYLLGEAGVKGEVDDLFKTLTADARVSVFHIAGNKDVPIIQYSADLVTAKVGASIAFTGDTRDGMPTYAGIEARVCLVELSASVFELKIGPGVDTGLGLKDDSIKASLLGCGFTVGRKIAISHFWGSFGIDLGRFKW